MTRYICLLIASLVCAIMTSAQPIWPAPRRSAGLTLQLLWRNDSQSGKASLLYPIDVQFSSAGLLVFDYGEMQVKVLDPASGALRHTLGGRGAGPGEFNGPVQLFGTWAHPLSVQFSSLRVTSLSSQKSRSVAVATSGLWASGCTTGKDVVLLQTSGDGAHDYFLSTKGQGARVIDSMAVPWARLQALPFILRQAGLRQLDDSTCALLPLYQEEFAILPASGQPRLGLNVESVPPATAKIESSDKRRSASLTRGAKPGAVDARGWRDAVIVLFRGTTRLRGRILDVYSRSDLTYRGSAALPFEALRIAIRGDTLVAVGEDDADPVVAAFLIQRVRR